MELDVLLACPLIPLKHLDKVMFFPLTFTMPLFVTSLDECANM